MSDRYAVIGNPIVQSKSPFLHAAFAQQFGHDIRYGRLLGTQANFAQIVRDFRASGARGMASWVVTQFSQRNGSLAKASA